MTLAVTPKLKAKSPVIYPEDISDVKSQDQVADRVFMVPAIGVDIRLILLKQRHK
jgi:hypothetical protein